MRPVLITSNAGKARTYAEFLGIKLEHQPLELDEIQSLDVREVAEHKARQAYGLLKKPIIVDDVSMSMAALGGELPGPFIKWFLVSMGHEGLCRLADRHDNRRAEAKICTVYFDGRKIKSFQGSVKGTISDVPRKGPRGYGWDLIFIPDGSAKTYSEMDAAETQRFGLRQRYIFPKLRPFLEDIDKPKA